MDLQVAGLREVELVRNPTGVVNPRKNPSDPNDRGEHIGSRQHQGRLFRKDQNLSVLAVPEIDWNRAANTFVLRIGLSAHTVWSRY
jgi:hypothetical protein